MKQITLNKEIYSQDAVVRAVKDYKQFARITIADKNDYWIVKFFACKYDELRTIKEFENYLIDLENN